MRGSSIIRGIQIAEYLKAKSNPESNYNDDICIYVKPNTQDLYAKKIQLAPNAYIDVIDGANLKIFASHNPHIPLIACSKKDYEYLSNSLKNKVVFIPQHHCNIERIIDDPRPIEKIGMIGTPETFDYFPNEIRKKWNIKIEMDFKTREDVINFYRSIDLQIIWRPWKDKLSNPLKLVNACAFGIPTIALQEEALEELKDFYQSVTSIAELDNAIREIMGKTIAKDRYYEKSEEYHISKIAQEYLKLEVYA
jgi:hypothetical protein